MHKPKKKKSRFTLTKVKGKIGKMVEGGMYFLGVAKPVKKRKSSKKKKKYK